MPRRCSVIKLPGGATAIVTREVPNCKFCRRASSKLCDYPLRGKKAGKTCDARMCDRCACTIQQASDDTIDYCPPHARLIAKEIENAVPKDQS